jgi:quinohemoprotein ethanol dehydrogenase
MGILTLAGAAWLSAQNSAKPPNVDAKLLRDAGSIAKDPLPGSWLSYGRNQSETRYSTLKLINDTNAKRLGLAWTYTVGAGGGNQEGTPLVWNNTLYGITTWSVVYALDAKTGKELWRWDPEVNQTAVRPKICCGIVNRGVAIYNGLIIAPVTDGRVVALDAMKAALKTWGGDFWTKGGGGAVWDGIAYDPETNLVYAGTGNAEPWHQKFRGAQGVDNLYTCSILAVDLTTGQLKWHFQTTPNDNWDYDSVQQLMLLDLKINGKTRKVITQASKNGFFWVLDRVTGEFISGAPYVKTTWALGLDAKGRPMVNPAAYYDTDPISLFPTGGGAHNWSPMSYSPLTGSVYIPVFLQPFTYAATAELKPNTNGYTRGSGDPKLIDSPAIGPPSAEGMRGALQAWDPVNQKLVWRIEGGGGIGGGTVATAGNLVFQVINDGRFRAVTADKGEIMYEIQTGRTGMAPPVTYEIDGKQYVAFQGGLGRPATTVAPNDAQVDNPPMLFVFALDGTAELPKPAPPPPPRPVAPEPEH